MVIVETGAPRVEQVVKSPSRLFHRASRARATAPIALLRPLSPSPPPRSANNLSRAALPRNQLLFNLRNLDTGSARVYLYGAEFCGNVNVSLLSMFLIGVFRFFDLGRIEREVEMLG